MPMCTCGGVKILQTMPFSNADHTGWNHVDLGKSIQTYIHIDIQCVYIICIQSVLFSPQKNMIPAPMMKTDTCSRCRRLIRRLTMAETLVQTNTYQTDTFTADGLTIVNARHYWLRAHQLLCCTFSKLIQIDSHHLDTATDLRRVKAYQISFIKIAVLLSVNSSVHYIMLNFSVWFHVRQAKCRLSRNDRN